MILYTHCGTAAANWRGYGRKWTRDEWDAFTGSPAAASLAGRIAFEFKP